MGFIQHSIQGCVRGFAQQISDIVPAENSLGKLVIQGVSIPATIVCSMYHDRTSRAVMGLIGGGVGLVSSLGLFMAAGCERSQAYHSLGKPAGGSSSMDAYEQRIRSSNRNSLLGVGLFVFSGGAVVVSAGTLALQYLDII